MLYKNTYGIIVLSFMPMSIPGVLSLPDSLFQSIYQYRGATICPVKFNQICSSY
jgi:hypothetical protein